MDWNIDGHKQQLGLLEKALSKNTLAHAYVFAGPEGAGKKAIAKALAKELLSYPSSGLRPPSPSRGEGNNEENYFHPDFLEIDGHEGIKIEQIRELSYKLSLKPYSAKYKIALIDAAEQMSTEAANALLKTLEEPKDYTYIFLITSNSQRLPKTILSRCQKITFGPLENSEIVKDEFYEVFANGQVTDRLIAAYDIADLETEEIKTTLNGWLKLLHKDLREGATKSLTRKISQVLLARKYLDQNVNTKLLLTNLMLNT